MAKRATGGMDGQDKYKGMETGGKSAQTGDYTFGASDKSFSKSPSKENRTPAHKSGKRVTGTVVSL